MIKRPDGHQVYHTCKSTIENCRVKGLDVILLCSTSMLNFLHLIVRYMNENFVEINTIIG